MRAAEKLDRGQVRIINDPNLLNPPRLEPRVFPLQRTSNPSSPPITKFPVHPSVYEKEVNMASTPRQFFGHPVEPSTFLINSPRVNTKRPRSPSLEFLTQQDPTPIFLQPGWRNGFSSRAPSPTQISTNFGSMS